MLISDKHRFAFIHTPKCAGDSITAALAPFSNVDASQGRTKHWSARRVTSEFFTEERGRRWDDYETFGVIRNPWQQVHSDYWFCRNSPVPGHELGTWRDKVIRAKRITFAQFVVDICGEHGRSGPGLFAYYLADENGDALVKHVVRFEELAARWPAICNTIRVGEVELPRINVTAQRPDYRDDYDDRSRFLVSRRFADDIQRFEYKFEE